MTHAQLTTFKAAILADANITNLVATGQTGAIAQYYAQDSTFWVWRGVTPSADISDSIIWDKLTPNDSPDGTTIFTNRALICQSKQLNLQIQLQSREMVSTGKANIRGLLSDALTNVPSGAGGTTVDAGWIGAGKVKLTITRLANKLEALFATGTGTSGSPGNLVVELVPGISDVDRALSS